MKEKKNGHWKTMYSVVRDLDVLKQVIILDNMCLNGDMCTVFRKQAS